ncbi:phage head closure protein [Pelagibacterium xiamenense]|uniref:phage head closure protein n=1 Tax=Pelagibacterium xiamenense TaxID=2901140 RepID=UPI001E3E8633|nr:phage head closure protein [Pelagibacterium xiamenense]
MRAAIPPVGTLRDRVQLQSRQTAVDAGGGHEAIYVPLNSVWARVTSRSARFAAISDGRAAASSHVVVVRYRSDLKPGDRIVYRGRRLDVVSTEDINGRKAYLACLCNETAMVG